ncbi:MAG: (Fe-S)-binding protein [Deltaproteobacteria bacterium]|nr:MAG: (Fe-S)-binding protein [Deltaproteobacteria bacterium]
MSLPKKHVLGILADNLKLRKSVLPLSRRALTRWARGLDIPYGGETVLYTGHMYQLIPKIGAMANRMAKFEDSWIRRWMGLGRVINRGINLTRFMAHAKRKERRAYDRVLRNIALLLREAGVEFGYLYGDEMYSGALLHDQGIDAVLLPHARRLQALFAEHGVRRVITVDPHTTNMLRSVFPEMLDGFDVEVRNYLEVLADYDLPVKNPLEMGLTIHDSCVYARYEDVIDQPRQLLARLGARLQEPELSGKMTHCCGGPIESLFPGKAHEIALKRVEQLSATGCAVAVMCPICMVNLKGAANGDGPGFFDIADVLAGAVLDDPSPVRQTTDERKER